MTASHSFADFYRKLNEASDSDILNHPEMFLGELSPEDIARNQQIDEMVIRDNGLSEVITPLDLGESSLDLEIPTDKEAGPIPALTPIMDKVDGFRSINWQQVMQQMRAGVNNVGVVIAVISEKTHQLGCFLAEV